MILEIDGLKMPPYISASTELLNFDTTQRTVSKKMITKLASSEKWRLTINYDKNTLSLAFQNAFYEKCLAMRSSARNITFVSPYDGTVKTIKAKCTSRQSPSILNLTKNRPTLYKDIGAVFEEI